MRAIAALSIGLVFGVLITPIYAQNVLVPSGGSIGTFPIWVAGSSYGSIATGPNGQNLLLDIWGGFTSDPNTVYQVNVGNTGSLSAAPNQQWTYDATTGEIYAFNPNTNTKTLLSATNLLPPAPNNFLLAKKAAADATQKWHFWSLRNQLVPPAQFITVQIYNSGVNGCLMTNDPLQFGARLSVGVCEPNPQLGASKQLFTIFPAAVELLPIVPTGKFGLEPLGNDPNVWKLEIPNPPHSINSHSPFQATRIESSESVPYWEYFSPNENIYHLLQDGQSWMVLDSAHWGANYWPFADQLIAGPSKNNANQRWTFWLVGNKSPNNFGDMKCLTGGEGLGCPVQIENTGTGYCLAFSNPPLIDNNVYLKECINNPNPDSFNPFQLSQVFNIRF